LTRLRLYLLAAVVLVLDQLTKSWVNRVHGNWPNGSEVIIPGFFSFTYVQNTGGAFGIFDTARSGTLALAGISLVVAAVIILYTLRLREPLPRLLVFALGLALGGAIGNLVDRLRLHYVVDFLDVYIGTHHWPVFNLADSAICVGVALLALHFSLSPTHGKSAASAMER
jgi:signal peptidase II